jgi:hypothetical protein
MLSIKQLIWQQFIAAISKDLSIESQHGGFGKLFS